MSSETVIHTDLPLEIINKGKVRDIYEINNNLLLVVTDRISAFDYVLPNPIPSKGVCLTQLSKFWFDYTKDIVPNHMIFTELEKGSEKAQLCVVCKRIIVANTPKTKVYRKGFRVEYAHPRCQFFFEKEG